MLVQELCFCSADYSWSKIVIPAGWSTGYVFSVNSFIWYPWFFMYFRYFCVLTRFASSISAFMLS